MTTKREKVKLRVFVELNVTLQGHVLEMQDCLQKWVSNLDQRPSGNTEDLIVDIDGGQCIGVVDALPPKQEIIDTLAAAQLSLENLACVLGVEK
jgi:hypothetical protein